MIYEKNKNCAHTKWNEAISYLTHLLNTRLVFMQILMTKEVILQLLLVLLLNSSFKVQLSLVCYWFMSIVSEAFHSGLSVAAFRIRTHYSSGTQDNLISLKVSIKIINYKKGFGNLQCGINHSLSLRFYPFAHSKMMSCVKSQFVS